MVINVQNLDECATLLGIWLAFWQYIKSLHERQKQIIVGLKNQLKVSSVWASIQNEGYLGEPSDERKLNFSQPFRYVFEIESSTIKSIMIQPGIIDFSDKFLEAVANYNQLVRSIYDTERFLEQLSFSDVRISQLIQEKWKIENNKLKSEQTHLSFMNSFQESLEDEKHAKYIVDKIYYFNHYLHYKLIGSRHSEGLNQYHRTLTDEIGQQEKEILKKEKNISVLLGLGSIPVIISFLFLFGVEVISLRDWVVVGAIGLLIGILLILKINHKKET